MKIKSSFVTPLSLVVVISLVILLVVTGVLSYLSVYNESINTIQQQNSALVNRLEGWLNVQSNRLETNFAFLREHLDGGDISVEMLKAAFTVQGEAEEVSMLMAGLPDDSFIHGGYWPGAADTPATTRIWYFAAAERPGEIFFLSPYWGPATRRFVFAVARTINDYDCSEGVFAMSMPFYVLQDFISRGYYDQYTHSFVLDYNGNILFHPNEAFYPIEDGVFQNINYVEYGRFAEMFSEIKSNGIHVGDGAVHVGEVSGITGWYVITMVPTSYIISATSYTLGSLVAAAIFALVTIAGTMYFFRKLKEQNEEVKRASLAKSAFVANMSHEIRTPMNSIVGFSELALEDSYDMTEKTQSYLQMIKENSIWLLQIINDILDISKIESGKMELELVPFKISNLLTQCESILLPKAIEKGINLQFHTDPFVDKVPVIGDPLRLRQVFVNVLSNAIKFTNAGDIRVLTSITENTETKKTIYFEVKDSGIGMTPDQIKRIFEPFSQADVSITRKYGGTGLGLSIVQNMLHMMGGKLDVESIAGEGSTFSFELTFDASLDAQEAPQSVIAPDSEKYYFGGEILVCEDNRMNQLVISEHLRRLGLDFVIADNGKDGIEILEKRIKNGKLFDLILMDIYMPVMDGLDATATIQKMDTNIPIVAMTANIMDDERGTYRGLGMADCIGKPFTSQELKLLLLKFFVPIPKPGEENAQPVNDLQKVLETGFIEENENVFAELKEALQDADIKKAHRIAHTLKSSAGLIRRRALQEAAANVEFLLKEGKNKTTPAELKNLELELEAVLSELSDTEAVQPDAPGIKDDKPCVLIVDDAPINIRALTHVLSDKYTVLGAKDGATALGLAEVHRPDIILLDIIMPEMDGYEVLEKLKASEKTRKIPVIFVSGNDGDMDDKGVELGAADYIHKPFNANIVKLRIKNYIELMRLKKLQRR